MNVIYILTTLSIYTLFMLLFKTEKKQNLITWLAISALLVLCYNTLLCVILSFVNILCTLQNLSICNGIIALILLAFLLKTKKVQKYYVKKIDIIFAVVLVMIVGFIAYNQYGFPFDLKYKITDGSTHYFFANEFYKRSTLLYKGDYINDIFGMYDSDFRLPGAYVNEGILFKVFDNIMLKSEVYVLFDLFTLYLSGILFYGLIQKHITKENKKTQILSMIFPIIYMFGYQLNSMLYGYVYLSLALSMIIGFFILIASYDKKEFESRTILLMLALMSFGVFFSYAYFIPIIYIGIIANWIIQAIINKESLLSEDNLMYIWCILVIPLILGLTFFIILPGAKGIKNEISTIGTDGKIYENYITNFIVFIPIIITSIVLSVKSKKKDIDFGMILFALSIIFAIILFVGNKLEIVSAYYFFKAYYIIWPLAIYNAFVAIYNILDSGNKKLETGTIIYIGTYIVTILISTFILKLNIGINNIFYHNVECIEHEWKAVLHEEVVFADYVEKTMQRNQIYVLSPKFTGRARWISILYNNEFIFFNYASKHKITIEEWLTSKDEKYYLAYYRDYKELEENNEEPSGNHEKYKIINNDEYAFILEKTN